MTLTRSETVHCHECGGPLPTGPCSRCAQRTQLAGAVRRLLDRDDVFVLDTETTGLKGAEVIEVALIDTCGQTRLDTLVWPKTARMNPYAQRVHGLSLHDLSDQPSWPEVLPELLKLTRNATILAWNAPFDARMLEQTSAVWGLPHPKLLFVCAMRLYAKTHGKSAYGLHKAVVTEGLDELLNQHQSHRALGDVWFVLELLRHLAR